MGTPRTRRDRFAALWDWAGRTVRAHVTAEYDPAEVHLLDVGAGWGKYRDVFPECDNMDAVEIWQANVDRERLRERYRNVFCNDIYDHVLDAMWGEIPYHFAILGDVLEHLPVDRAVPTIELLLRGCRDVLVVVPYLYEQGEGEDGNPYEIHHQDDLTPDVMYDRYPMLELAGTELRNGREFKGLYRRKGT